MDECLANTLEEGKEEPVDRSYKCYLLGMRSECIVTTVAWTGAANN